MAAADRTSPAALGVLDALAARPAAFEYFEALRALECLYPDQPRLGRASRPSHEPVRLRHFPTLRFAPAALREFRRGDDRQPHVLVGEFFGLFGPNGPLPVHLTEFVFDRLHNAKDTTASRFADVFHHRLMCLLYRAWAEAQPTVQRDRPASDRFMAYVSTAAGRGSPAMLNRDAWPDEAKAFYAGRLGALTRNQEGLEDLISGYFEVPVRVEEFVGEWLRLPPDGFLRLGVSPEFGALGRTAVLGSRSWSCQQKFRILIGPLSFARFEQFLPGNQTLEALMALVRNYVGDEFDWDLQLLLDAEEVPSMQLGRTVRLGWVSWFTPRLSPAAADDVILELVAPSHAPGMPHGSAGSD